MCDIMYFFRISLPVWNVVDGVLGCQSIGFENARSEFYQLGVKFDNIIELGSF